MIALTLLTVVDPVGLGHSCYHSKSGKFWTPGDMAVNQKVKCSNTFSGLICEVVTCIT